MECAVALRCAGWAPNAAVQRPRAALSGAAQVHNAMTRLRRAAMRLEPSAATACYTPRRRADSQSLSEDGASFER